jgi:hypothetical protein
LKIVDVFYGHLEYYTDIWDILWPLGTFCVHWVHFVFIGYIFSGFGITHHEKSGNPGLESLIAFLFTQCLCLESFPKHVCQSALWKKLLYVTPLGYTKFLSLLKKRVSFRKLLILHMASQGWHPRGELHS